MNQQMESSVEPEWQKDIAPVAIVMISLNEAHNMQAVLDNLKGWAQEIYLVDSYSADDTVDIALANGVHVVQRNFRGFGDQWNFALEHLPIQAPWVMKLDPDERLTDELKQTIVDAIARDMATGLSFSRRLWFMGKPLPIRQEIVRIWKAGYCRFTDVAVNEHPLVDGLVAHVDGDLEHHDSPDLHHWVDKQNRYSTAEAVARMNRALAASAKLFGSRLERKMWVKRHFDKLPMRFLAVFLFYYLFKGLFRAGWVGYTWSKLRAQVYWMRYIKYREMLITGRTSFASIPSAKGQPDPRVPQY